MPSFSDSLVLLFGPFASADASAVVSKALKAACREDYRAYCSAFEVASEELKACMRAVQHKLSKRCAKAIAQSGEATKEEIERYKARHKH